MGAAAGGRRFIDEFAGLRGLLGDGVNRSL
jgi:hypothetical protein